MKPKSTLRHFICLASTVLVTVNSASAIDYYWNQNSTTSGWGAGGAWSTSSAVFTAAPEDPLGTAVTATTGTGDTLFIGSATTGFAGGTLTLGATQSIGSIITGSANSTAGVAIDTQTLTFAAAGVITNNSSQALTIGSVIGGAGTSLTLNAVGDITLSAATNTYGGITFINSGTVTVNNNFALGTGGTNASRTEIASGARLNFNNTPRSYTEHFVIAGAGVGGASGALNNGQASTTLSGVVTLSGAATIFNSGGLTLSGGIALGGNALTFLSGGTTTVQTNGISNGSVVKSGAGTLNLSASNSYAGGTTISNGTLNFLNTTAKAATGTHAFGAGTTIGLGVATSGTFFTGTDVTNAFAGTMTGNLSNVTVTATTNVGIDTTAATFVYATSIAGSPSKGLVKLGTNALTLSGTNTHTGGTSLTSGTLNINSDTAVGTGALNITGGTTLDNTSGAARTLTNNNTITATSGFTFTGGNDLNLGTGAFNSSLTGGNQFVFTVSGSKLTVGGTFTSANTNGVAKSGNGTLSLMGNANAFSTFILVNAGVLEVNKLANGGSASSIGTSAATATNFVFASGTTLRYVGTGDSSNRLFQMSGVAGASFTLDASGSGALNWTSTSSMGHGTANVARTFNLAGTNTDNNTYAGNITNNGTGVLSVVKNGTGTWLLTGTTSSYTGGTTVTQGILNTNNSTALSGFSVAGRVIFNGGTLGVQVGGAGWTTANVDTMLSNATKTSGALGIDTTNGSLNQWTAFTTTNLGSSLGLNKFGVGTLTLDLANNYTGSTVISNGTLSLTGSLTGGGAISTNTTGILSQSAAGVISGASTVSVGGSGTSILAGNNNYTGTTVISNGTLSLTGSLTGGGAISTNTTGILSQSAAGVISGASTVSVGGSGASTLAGNNTYSGLTTVSGSATLTLSGNNIGAIGGVTLSTSGTGVSTPLLNLNSATALGTGTLLFGGGASTDTVRLDNTSAGLVSVSTANAMTLNRNFTFIGTESLNLGSGTATLSGMTTGTRRSITVTGNTLTFDGVVTETTPGTSNFGITLGGNGTLSLTNEANTFTGKTVIGNNVGSSLKLQVTKLADVGVVSSLGAAADAAFGLIQIGSASNPSTLELVGGTSASTTNRQIQIGSSANGSGGATILNNNTNAAHTLTFSNAAFNVAATGLTGSSRSLTLGGTNTGDNTVSGAIVPNIGGAGTTGVVKSGTGTWVLNGTSSFTGAVTVQNGILKVNSITDSGTNSAVGAGTLIAIGSSTTGTLVYTGSGNSATRSIRVGSGTVGESGGGVLNSSGTGALTFTAATFNTAVAGVTAARNLTLGGTYTATVNEIQGNIVNNDTGTGGTVSITKNGAGTWKLSGTTNTYSGTTNVEVGTLIVNGNISTSVLTTVSTGATLGGTGTVGALTVDGIIAPGNSIGTLNVTGDVTWNDNDSWVFELGTAAASLALANAGSSTQDMLNITGGGNDFLKGSGSSFTFDFSNSGAVGFYKLVDWASATGFSNGDFVATNLTSGLTGTFNVDSGTSALYLTVIPEPNIASLIGALGGILLLRRRR